MRCLENDTSYWSDIQIKEHSEVKKQLWGGGFWSDGYFVSTVGKHGDENMIGKYVQSQGTKQPYKKLHADYQLALFWRDKYPAALRVGLMNLYQINY